MMNRFFLVVSIAAALLSACGGGGGDSVPTPVNPQPAGASTAVQINLGDAPADRLLAVGMTVQSVTLTKTSGGPVPVLSAPRQVELMHLMGTVAPLALASVPQGTYSGATMTFSEAKVTHVDAVTGQIAQRTAAGPMTAHVAFSPPLSVGTTPTVINFDMDMAATVAIDANGNVAVTPMLRAHSNPAVAGSRHPEDGGVHGLIGMVGGVQGNGFNLATTQGLTGIPMTTHSGTHFSGVAGTHMMIGNMLVAVDGKPQADGSWLASHVESRMGAGGSMAAGVITGVSGSPPTQLTLVMHDGAGNGMQVADLAGTTTVNVAAGTTYSIDADDIDLSGLPFTPRFDRGALSKGQRIRAWSGSAMTHDGHGMGGGMQGGGTVAATTIELQPQGLRGTVSAYASSGAPATFTLTLPADSAFARLTGAKTVTVHQQANTQLRGLTSITNGSIVLVRGMLFLDGGAFRLVAGRIVAG